MAGKVDASANQEEFVRQYLSNGRNASAAYRAVFNPPAGTDPHTLCTKASRYKNKPEVQAMIQKLTEERYRELDITAEHIAQELAEMAFALKGDEDYTAQVKLKALDLLQKQLGLQTKNVKAEAEVSAAVTFVDDLKPDENQSE
jgi:phage terminase small subunit